MPDYSIWMLEFAWVPDAPTSSLVYGRHNMGNEKLPYCYTLLKGHGKTILVDCGVNYASHGREFLERFNVQNWFSPKEVLAEVGCTPEQIDHVILTHAHFDHMGGLELFPNATFHIQQEELAAWVSIMALDRRFRWLLTATDTGDMLYAVQLAREGRMRGIDGNVDNILPGIDVRIARDTHTAGSQYVVIRNDGKSDSDDVFVYPGDLLYRHDNLHGGIAGDPMYLPVGLAFGSQTKLIFATHEIMKCADFDIRRVLIPHEPAMTKMYPSRTTKNGHYLIEVVLAEGQQSYV
ncbi:N-acyl homoserine lactonase family protein [Sinorhizobium prairiense]|uniref:N-acyl homoserine lactonase family protein n=1 Tax=unclassified Sinorhizobium TaxID=2613772 RepID=UPI0023D8AF2F|nr:MULTISPECIES: N-acyl homoserine lactonase family protein [unclassified Sinorhizobium]WEJ08388.1 N-acyl homoserine lactonase family protein [Sinorhizobium sp. M103]WEJ14106.1 N-acyl homoserine lactonase family protein [Sinorhizobium sp. K101]WEJ35708.1 N-acyl homoserine lactonase family protein [Sinorhizobium sp. C101]